MALTKLTPAPGARRSDSDHGGPEHVDLDVDETWIPYRTGVGCVDDGQVREVS